ncbi:MAG: radical SAM protein [Armatimonadia bacterium]|nr:radical SAM protein [Armatimonadia bacterium]
MGLFPSYLNLHQSGELARRAASAMESLGECRICPQDCGVDRLAGETGVCGLAARAAVASHGPHYGEERPLVGQGGSGTVFFSGCNLRCVFCQNYDISHRVAGRRLETDELASAFIDVQRLGCHNLNLVSPTHVLPQVLVALAAACDRGLQIPIVWNSGGYDSLPSLELLDGIVDIYLPDAKYSDPDAAGRLSGARDYPEVNRAALREMHRQVGSLEMGERGVARRGLMIRHLVLPDGLAGSGELARFVAEELSPHTFVNVMGQYRPCFMARSHPGVDRHPTRAEYRRAHEQFRQAGLYRLDGPH